MNVFVSWSGKRSRRVAESLSRFLPSVLQRVRVFNTLEKIDAGVRWHDEIRHAIENTDFGIAIITQENMNSQWIAWEMGALTTKLDPARFMPVLIDVSFSDFGGPLATHQAVRADKAGIRLLVSHINESCGDPIPDDLFSAVFENMWPRFEQEILSVTESAWPETSNVVLPPDSIVERLTALEKRVVELESQITNR